MKRIQSLVGVTSGRHDVSYVLRICAVAALGGILLGDDTSVISGAIGPIRAHFHLSDAATDWAVSSVILGCIIGAFGSGWLARAPDGAVHLRRPVFRAIDWCRPCT